ncbi:MAG: CYTH domain-containing protein, partial [Trueperaceae bacterium]
MPTETELKFSRVDEHVPSEMELAAAFEAAGLRVGPAKRVLNVDRYFDDARASLARVGYALRTRMSDGAMLATLKTLGSVEGALHRRDELELPLPEDASGADPWPEAIAERVRMV